MKQLLFKRICIY